MFWVGTMSMPIDHTQVPGHMLMYNVSRQFQCLDSYVPVIYDGNNLGSPINLLLSYCMLGAHLDSRREKLVALWLLTQCWHGRWQGGMESSSVRAGCSLQATSTEGDGAFTVNSGGWSLVCKLFHWDFLFASRYGFNKAPVALVPFVGFFSLERMYVPVG